jgi:hypothetical protein
VLDRRRCGSVGGIDRTKTNHKCECKQSSANKICRGSGHNFLVLCFTSNNTGTKVSPLETRCQQRLNVITSETTN